MKNGKKEERGGRLAGEKRWQSARQEADGGRALGAGAQGSPGALEQKAGTNKESEVIIKAMQNGKGGIN